jgi:hypothetical protein
MHVTTAELRAARLTRSSLRGGSTTVSVNGQTVVDLPTRRAGGTVAERPPSRAVRGRSTTVYTERGPIKQPPFAPTSDVLT